MEITNEIKAKVFAQYLGHRVELDNGGSKVRNRILCAVGGIDDGGHEYLKLKMGTFAHAVFIKENSAKLILKPLSEITDEDAMEVANICNGGDGIKGIHKYDYKTKDKAKFYIELKGEFEDDKNNTLIFFYEDGSFDKFHPNAGEKGEHFDLSDWQTLNVYQFLQSKGYDIPQYLLGGKTLKECGLAVYEGE